jgi:hypothetical protein
MGDGEKIDPYDLHLLKGASTNADVIKLREAFNRAIRDINAQWRTPIILHEPMVEIVVGDIIDDLKDKKEYSLIDGALLGDWPPRGE